MEIIYVTAMGPVDEEDLNLAETAVRHTFGYEVRRLPPLALNPVALDSYRGQWNSSLLLRQVSQACPADGLRLVAVTAVDIFISMLTFVFGQAQLGGRAALVSTAQLRPEFYGFPANRPLLSGRLVKEVIHEVGHTFGLVHCPDPTCPMSLSTTLRQVDQKGSELCWSCRLSLKETASRPDGDASTGSSP